MIVFWGVVIFYLESDLNRFQLRDKLFLYIICFIDSLQKVLEKIGFLLVVKNFWNYNLLLCDFILEFFSVLYGMCLFGINRNV